ncbi:MAG: sugar phosphate isomerase/epimerase family protein [Paracoccaceae bacterium]
MSLRYAWNTNGCAHHRLDDALAMIADAGYDGVALTLDHNHLDPFAEDWKAQAERLAARLGELGLGSVIETGARYLLDPRLKHEPTLISPEPEGRARRIAFYERATEIAAILGSETVSFWSGVPREGVERDRAWSWLVDGVATVAVQAENAGVEVSVEPEPGMLVETVADWARLRDDLRSVTEAPVTLALDTGHCLVTGEGEPADMVRAYAGALGTVAIEDMKRGSHVHLPFGQGDMDLPATLAALREAGFARLVTVELSRESHRAHEAIPEALAALHLAEGRLGEDQLGSMGAL